MSIEKRAEKRAIIPDDLDNFAEDRNDE